MPIPRWVAKLNRRVLNPREIKKGVRPVIAHVGRSSGRSYRTPLDAHPVDGGYVFILMYGSGSDWVQNVLASGSAVVVVDGVEHEVESPRLISEGSAFEIMAEDVKRPAGFVNVTEYLRVDAVGE